jgi:hypothetical protein
MDRFAVRADVFVRRAVAFVRDGGVLVVLPDA